MAPFFNRFGNIRGFGPDCPIVLCWAIEDENGARNNAVNAVKPLTNSLLLSISKLVLIIKFFNSYSREVIERYLPVNYFHSLKNVIPY